MTSLVSKLKKPGKALLCNILEWQVRRLRRKNDFKIIAVAGSVGKTSTKLAIAETLSSSRRVIYQAGNYNDRLTVPLVLFGRSLPGLLNVPAWLGVFVANELALRKEYPYEVAVLELGTDGPGQIAQFAYLKPEIAVVTAVAPEHMEFFGNLDAVAREELLILQFSKYALVNADDVPEKYLKGLQFMSYGIKNKADFMVKNHRKLDIRTQAVSFHLTEGRELDCRIQFSGVQGAKIALAAAATAVVAGMELPIIRESMERLAPFAGRMQILDGVRGSTIIDDTYNASPAAVKAALDVLYAEDTPQRIAVLGSMNELGAASPAAHEEIGGYCDPAKLDLVITIGKDAEKYLASAARKRGCSVKSFTSPYEAGEYAAAQLKDGGLVLAKGSQNGVFAEEALKSLLENKDDAVKLVRQSAHWLAVKRRQFPR